MATKVLVPRLGEGVDEVIITKWLKQIGDSINELEPLLEVNTDKVDTEIPAPVSGVLLNIAIQEGSTARVGELLAVIGRQGEALEAHPAQPASPAIHSPSPAQATQDSPAQAATPAKKDAGFISPVVAKMAGEYGIDLLKVTGTGLGGRITKNDILAHVNSNRQDSAATPPPPAPTFEPSTAAAPGPTTGDTLIKHSLIRKSIAEHMLASKRTSPHVLTVMEVDMSRVAANRSANKAAFTTSGVNLTYTAYFMAALVAGLKAYPLVNSSWSDDGIVVHSSINLGMATSLGEDGLIVPVIKNADSLSLLGLARSVNDLAARARAKKLQPDEVKGGTFTLTNHGISGSLFAMPIINQPQCAILGVGALQKRAVVVTDAAGNDAIAIRPMVYLSLVFDHRILDGASADWFLAKVKSNLETWKD
ncbi:MAG TPA: dihydrolipoamide acetyltransferase family protein [Anaerolineales bacterium]|jgi:2-oxoglutarate dehydrogenase E2 component (dihydrolipoamide succinyltransferase)